MKLLNKIGIEVTSKRDTGNSVEYVFDITPEDLERKVRLILELPIDTFEFSVPDPIHLDCDLEVKVNNRKFQNKRGCHGAYGSWKESSLQESLDWVMPGAAYASKKCPNGYGFSINVY